MKHEMKMKMLEVVPPSTTERLRWPMLVRFVEAQA
jgi:hypothetical protein